MAHIAIVNTGRSPMGSGTGYLSRGLYRVRCTKSEFKPTKKAGKMAVHLDNTILQSFVADASGKPVASQMHLNQSDSALVMAQDGQNQTADEIRESEHKALVLCFGLMSLEQINAIPKGQQFGYDNDHLVNREGWLLYDPPPKGYKGDRPYPERRFISADKAQKYISGELPVSWPWDNKASSQTTSAAVPGMTAGGGAPTGASALMGGAPVATPAAAPAYQQPPVAPMGAPPAMPGGAAPAAPAPNGYAPSAAQSVAGIAPQAPASVPGTPPQQWPGTTPTA